MHKTPFISVIIPVLKMNYYVTFENLPAFAEQTYDNFEVIVLPNTHDTYDITLLKKYPWLRIIPTGSITRPALKRDMGVKESKGDIIAFIDDDAYPKKDWLEQAVKMFNKHNVEAVCGPGSLPPNAGTWERIFDEVFKSWLGSGGYSYRFMPAEERTVDDYPSMNFLIKKEVFTKLGGFNNDYWPGEDSKLCNDLVYKEKGSIYYHPDVEIYHHRRTALKSYLKQHGNYGYHRGAFFAHGDKNSRRPGYLIPTFFVSYLIALIIAWIVSTALKLPLMYVTIWSIPLVVYAVGLVKLLLDAFINTWSLQVALGAPVTLFLTHIVYGIMFVKGYLKGRASHTNIYE